MNVLKPAKPSRKPARERERTKAGGIGISRGNRAAGRVPERRGNVERRGNAERRGNEERGGNAERRGTGVHRGEAEVAAVAVAVSAVSAFPS